MTEPPAATPIARADLIKAALFTIGWLLPIGVTAFTGYPPEVLPTPMRDVYSVSCLFDERPTRHSSFYVQVRRVDDPAFVDLAEDEYFGMQPFGHRNRFDRYMARYGWRKKDELAREELARWIAARHRELHPDEGAIVAVRFLFADTQIDGGPPPTGHWTKPKRAQLSPAAMHKVGTPVQIPWPAPEVRP